MFNARRAIVLFIASVGVLLWIALLAPRIGFAAKPPSASPSRIALTDSSSNPSGSHLNRITPPHSTEQLPALPNVPPYRDGIVFTRPYPTTNDTDSNVWIMNGDGSNPFQVTQDSGMDRQPALSHDGTRIAYIAWQNNNSTLHVINVDGTNMLTMPIGNGSQLPLWSPGDNQIAFINDSVDWWEIYLINSDGMNPRRLTTHAGPAGFPSWSPDGSKLVYGVESSPKVYDLYTVKTDGTNQQLLLPASSSGYSHHIPAWSPDGTQIAALRFPAGNYTAPRDLWLMNADGSNGRVLVSNIDSENVQRISWTLDGNWLIFGKGGQIWRIRRDGINLSLVQITTDGGWEPVTNVYSFTSNITAQYLPLIHKPLPKGIHGHVAQNGVNAAGVPLSLRFYNGSAWSTAATTTTDGQGMYSFPSAATLAAGQRYYVRYLNSGLDAGRLYFWGTRVLTSYTANSEVNIGDFDIGDIALSAPPNGATVSLPTTFRWTPRPATPSDSYALTLYDPADGDPIAQTVLLGYVGSVTIGGLPSSFRLGVPYAWEVWAYSPDGGNGISLAARQVTFSNEATSPRDSLTPYQDEVRIGELPPRLQR